MRTANRNQVSRRGLFTGLLLLSNPTLAAMCGLTPPQTEGPFYPEKNQQDKDWDLTALKGAKAAPLGEVITIEGIVQDEGCQPIPNALVEIWQAAASGRYNHSGDTSGLPLDPNFQYWGRAVTDKQGKYRFKTILPGHYPASPAWERPPHIHYKAFARGFRDLTTQMYFQGRSFPDKSAIIDRLNREDAILLGVPPAERAGVIVAFDSVDVEGIKTGRFDITLKRV